jgi:two-component system, NtrC family, response regulator HydG
MNYKVLVIEDDYDTAQLLKRFLSRLHLNIVIANNAKKGIEAFKKEDPNLVLCDYRLGEDLTGIDVLKKVKAINPQVPFIMITGYSDIKTAVQVMRLGAYDYLTKPLFPDEISLTVTNALEQKAPVRGNRPNLETDKFIFGTTPAATLLLKQMDLVAPTDYTVIIYGESGVGKEAVAQTIHKKSARAAQPFVAMDCGAISKELAGSELFGHEKGSFTGAIVTKIGHFELANGGTLFLDEVGNLPYEVQTSLLRVVQEKKVKRIGSNKEINVDVRLIIASNENLADAYKKGKFREDLFHRFNEFQISVLPLRERKEEIPLYAEFFLKSANERLGKNIIGFDDEVMTLFQQYPWYGNLRELKNIIKRAALLTEGSKIKAAALPVELSQHAKSAQLNHHLNGDAVHGKEEKPNLKDAAKEAEYETILRVLKEVNFNKSKAAKILNIDRKTLYNKIRSF